MRCLWITRQDPRPADSGELIYSRGLLGALTAQPGMDVTVMAHRAPKPHEHDAAGMSWELYGWVPEKRLRDGFSMLPSDAKRLGNETQMAALMALCSTTRWDWIFIDQAACGWALPYLPTAGRTRLVYVAHNHETSLRREVAEATEGSPVMRALLKMDARKYGKLEQSLCEGVDLITAITPQDRERFRQMAPETPVLCLPPGYTGPMVETIRPITESKPRRVVLAGAFEWGAKRRNLETFLKAADGVFSQAEIQFSVVGKANESYFAGLAKRYPWAGFHANVASIDPYLQEARIGLIPEELGGGFKLKALDYIFRGLPVAALTPALSGLPIHPAEDVIAADDPTSLVAEIVKRIDDTGFLNAAAASALEACRDKFHWFDRGAVLAEELHRIARYPK
jgi:hypothetical protein